MEFIQSILAHDEAVVAATVVTYDLPVNPLSHILLTLKMARLDTAVTDSPPFMSIPAIISRIEVLYKGSAVYSLSGVDCMASSLHVNGFESWGVNAEDIENGEWAVTLLVPLTRTLYSPIECFPASTRGELILQITYAAASAEWDDIRMQIETVELLGVTPQQFLKQTTLSATPTANIPLDIPLPIGNDITDIVIWQHQIQTTTSDVAAIDKMEILVDNINKFYPESFTETIQNMSGRKRCPPGYWGSHVHKTYVTPVVAGDPTGIVIAMNHILACWMHLPFDIFKNGEYALKTAGASAVLLRLDIVAFGALRIIPLEIIKSAGSV